MNVRRIASDFVVFSRGYFRSPIGLFFSLVFPLILIAMFGVIFSGGSSSITLYTENLDEGSNASAQYISALDHTGAVSVTLVSVSDIGKNASLSDWLVKNSHPVGLVIPAGFGAALSRHLPVNVTLYVNPQDPSSQGIAEGAVNGVNEALNFRAVNGTPIVGLTAHPVGSQVYKYIDYLVPGLIGFTILTSPMFSMVEISSSYRKDHLFRQLSLTPLTKGEWLTSKILWYIALTFVTGGIMLATGIVAFHAHVGFNLGIVPFLILGPFFFVSLGMLAGSVARTPETAAIVGNVVTFPMMFLSGTFFPVSQFPQGLQVFAHILPLYYVIDGMNQALLFHNYGSGFFLDLGVILAGSIVVFVLAILAFKWRDE